MFRIPRDGNIRAWISRIPAFSSATIAAHDKISIENFSQQKNISDIFGHKIPRTPGIYKYLSGLLWVLLLAPIRHESKYLTWHGDPCHAATLAWSIMSRDTRHAPVTRHTASVRKSQGSRIGGKNTQGIILGYAGWEWGGGKLWQH